MLVGEFYKVSFEQFQSDSNMPVNAREIYDDIELPRRATSGSAGYDFVSPFEFYLEPGGDIKIPTGIRVEIVDGWWLACLPRSSLGFKYKVGLANTIAVVDADYFYSKNEGHIFIKLVNNGDKLLHVAKGDRIAQGIFVPFGITYSDDAEGVRDGGIGSTGA